MDGVVAGIADFLIKMATSNPKLVSVLAIGYTVSIAIKLIREAAAKYVAETPDNSDNLKLEKLEQNKVVKVLLFLADVLVRAKIEKK